MIRWLLGKRQKNLSIVLSFINLGQKISSFYKLLFTIENKSQLNNEINKFFNFMNLWNHEFECLLQEIIWWLF
jgi:hypothetical protein